MFLNKYADITKTLSESSDAFNASEIYATAQHFEEKLNTLKRLNPASMLDDIDNQPSYLILYRTRLFLRQFIEYDK